MRAAGFTERQQNSFCPGFFYASESPERTARRRIMGDYLRCVTGQADALHVSGASLSADGRGKSEGFAGYTRCRAQWSVDLEHDSAGADDVRDGGDVWLCLPGIKAAPAGKGDGYSHKNGEHIFVYGAGKERDAVSECQTPGLRGDVMKAIWLLNGLFILLVIYFTAAGR